MDFQLIWLQQTLNTEHWPMNIALITLWNGKLLSAVKNIQINMIGRLNKITVQIQVQVIIKSMPVFNLLLQWFEVKIVSRLLSFYNFFLRIHLQFAFLYYNNGMTKASIIFIIILKQFNFVIFTGIIVTMRFCFAIMSMFFTHANSSVDLVLISGFNLCNNFQRAALWLIQNFRHIFVFFSD